MNSAVLFKAGLLTQEELFLRLFSSGELLEVFEQKFESSKGKGVDRINGVQFKERAPAELIVASAKILAGTFRFSPYLEHLKAKGRGKAPRLIGIPTVRDRVVLNQLNAFLGAVFPERVPRNIASTYVKEIAEDLAKKDSARTWVCGTDIRTFYDSIVRERLNTALAKKIEIWQVLRLLKRALSTPTVPKDARRNQHAELASDKGVPQGLAISNILASIYMQEVDDPMSTMKVTYYRYVDDVLMYGSQVEVAKAHRSLQARLRRRGLGLHPLGSGKSRIGPMADSFAYLGYVFNWPQITVRSSTRERFLQSIAAMFSAFVHQKDFKLKKFAYLDETRLKEIFLLELNERISGAISENRRYGWIAYFNQINDHLLLHKLDRAIQRMFHRLPEFGHSHPASLKKISRAFYEMKYRPDGGYVHNYDVISTRARKLDFLIQRGEISETMALSDEDIEERFLAYRNRVLGEMQADEGVIYG